MSRAKVNVRVNGRRMVTIDPEDREQVERLVRAFWAANTDDGDDDCIYMRAALRSLVADPKPGEPQGLGAVVEDAAGVTWIRHYTDATNAGAWVASGTTGPARYFRNITAVRVLSEGVTS